MRVLHLIDHSPPLATSYVRRVMAILRQQRARGWQTCQLTGFRQPAPTPTTSANAGAQRPRHPASAPSTDSADGSHLHFFRTPAPRTAADRLPLLGAVRLLAKRLHEVVRLTRPDIIHAHSPVELALAALRVGRRHGVPVVFEVHAPSSRGQPGTVWCRTPGRDRSAVAAWAECVLEQWAARQAGAVVTNSEWVRNRLLAAGVHNTRMHFIPDGVGSGTRNLPDARRELGAHLAQSAPASVWPDRPAAKVQRTATAPGGGAVAQALGVEAEADAFFRDSLTESTEAPAWWAASADEASPLPPRPPRWTAERLALAALRGQAVNPATVAASVVIGFTVADCSRGSTAGLEALFAAVISLCGQQPGLRLLAACRAGDRATVQEQAARHGLSRRLTLIVLAKEKAPGASALMGAPANAARKAAAALAGVQQPAIQMAAQSPAARASPSALAPADAMAAHADADDNDNDDDNDDVGAGASITQAHTHLEQRTLLHRHADILVFPCAARHPAAAPPRALLAAMADACLIAAADCPPHRAVVDHGRSGVLFAAEDSAALARTLQTVLKCRERWEAMRSAARWCIEFQRDWQANGERYNNLYLKLLEERHR